MANSATIDVSAVEPAALHMVAALTGSSGLPVSLQLIAESLNVRHLRVLPLLCRAGLRALADGYEVIVDSCAPGISSLPSSVIETHAVGWENLAPTLRFWIAHEFAHIVFINCAKSEKRKQIKYNDNLERACSRVARALLLPDNHLPKNTDWSDPQIATTLSREAKISLQVLLYRLAHANPANGDEQNGGFIAYATEENGDVEIAASYLWGTQAKARFGKALHRADGRPIRWRDLELGPLFDAAANDFEPHSDERLSVRGRGNTVLPCRVLARPVSGSWRSYLVGLKVLGPPTRDAMLYPEPH